MTKQLLNHSENNNNHTKQHKMIQQIHQMIMQTETFGHNAVKFKEINKIHTQTIFT